MLARSVADRVGDNRHELLKIVGEEEEDKERDVVGFMYPCKLEFDNEFCLLISHDDEFQVTAIDGKYFLFYITWVIYSPRF